MASAAAARCSTTRTSLNPDHIHTRSTGEKRRDVNVLVEPKRGSPFYYCCYRHTKSIIAANIIGARTSRIRWLLRHHQFYSSENEPSNVNRRTHKNARPMLANISPPREYKNWAPGMASKPPFYFKLSWFGSGKKKLLPLFFFIWHCWFFFNFN